MITVTAGVVGCSGPSESAPVIPYTGETESVSITLYDETGASLICECVLYDAVKIREIIDCLTPYTESTAAKAMFKSPIVGRVEFRGPRGSTTVEFVKAGLSPLCFRLGGKAFARHFEGYRGHRSDHKRLYNSDDEHYDEQAGFYQKLMQFCSDNKAHPEQKPPPPTDDDLT